MYRRTLLDELVTRMGEPRSVIQVVADPRQVGKSTMVKQMLQEVSSPGRKSVWTFWE